MTLRELLVFRSRDESNGAERDFRDNYPDLYEFFRAEKRIEKDSGVIAVDLVWRNEHYFAYAYEQLYLESDGSSVVLLSRVTRPLTRDELRFLNSFDPERVVLRLGDEVDLMDKPQVNLSRKGDTLTNMTQDQEVLFRNYYWLRK